MKHIKNIGFILLTAGFCMGGSGALLAQTYPPGTASSFVSYLAENPGGAFVLKADFATMPSGTAQRIAMTASNKADKLMYLMLYQTRSWVWDNYTDDELKSLSDFPRSLKNRASAAMSRASAGQIANLAEYPPATVASLYEALAEPYFRNGLTPYGANGVTWAAWSLWSFYRDAGKVSLARRSVLIRLLHDEGVLIIPEKSAIEFAWSGMSAVVIDLSFVHWSKRDVPALKKLLDNPYYGEMAAKRLDQIGK